MKRLFLFWGLVVISCGNSQAQRSWAAEYTTAVSASWPRELARSTPAAAPRRGGLRWPWRAERMDYFTWWSKKVGLRALESFEIRPGVRYFQQRSQLTYLADATVFGGDIVIDDDLLNAVNFPAAIERPLRGLLIELPTGQLTRSVKNWTSLVRTEVNFLGLSLTGSYWSGALSPGQFPQPQDLGTLFNKERLIGVVAQEVAATSALNNAVSLEIAIHPLQILSGLRKLEWVGDRGFYVGGDLAFGWLKATDLTFKQGRELFGEIDVAQQIRDVLPDPLEALINTDEAGDVLLTALESRFPLYGFGLPITTGRTFELETWAGYQWSNNTWTGDARLGFTYQWQRLGNDHPSNPILLIRRWTPTVLVKWVFNKKETRSALFRS